MREFILKLFSEKSFGGEISLFSFWHFFYLFLIFGTAILLTFLLKDKSEKARSATVKIFAYLTIGLYIADFFIMPLSDSYNGISDYKLPFNICTIMAVLVPFVEFNKKFEPIKEVVVILSMASSLMWMCYPGSALGGQPPFSYIIFQTFMYHGFLFIWAVLSLTLEKTVLNIKNCWKVMLGILMILIWAWFGNTVYAKYDWFFITGETFPFLPKQLMPIIVVSSVFGVSMVIYGIYYLIRLVDNKIKSLKNKA
ncbi:MAG: YwaF family protein [Clostridia bacterium]|nr:YwaF family protein [Clostridia bacterium]